MRGNLRNSPPQAGDGVFLIHGSIIHFELELFLQQRSFHLIGISISIYYILDLYKKCEQ